MQNEYVFTLLFSSCFTNSKMCARGPVTKGMDQDLKRACEAVISIVSEPLCAPLRAFTGRPASAAEAAVLDEAFREACARDLRASIARVRLYVPDARTATVLVQHAVARVEDAYSAFRLAARQVGAHMAAGENSLMDDDRLKRLLKDVCGEEEVGDGTGST
jgi:conserved oligomeric Golgi complex subunit 3